ncbi:MAG TPA: GNAT family N-acetyltransferase [Tepidisphaeraceae bacterium]
MPNITIREVRAEALLTTAFPLRAYAFGGSPAAADPERWVGHADHLAACCVLVLFDDGRPLATATSVPFTQTVRGKLLPGAGISFVATHPGARRQGHQTRVIGQLLANMRERGETVAALYPSRASFYATFGFIGFPSVSLVQFPPERLALLVRQPLPGEIELLPHREGFDRYHAYLTRIQPAIHGFALGHRSFATHWPDRSESWIAFAHVDGVIRGAMTYAISRFGGDLLADEFSAAGGTAKYLLLQWLGRHAEQVESVGVILPPDARFETWLVDVGAAISLPEPNLYRTPMARIISLDALDGLQVGPGSFTARITDRWCPWNEGAHTFASVDGLLRVTPATDADCDLASDAVSALVYGGYDPDDFPIRGWGAPPDATAVAMRSMFPPALPFLYARF